MRWLFRNFKNRVQFALGNPLYSLNSLYREFTLADERFLSIVTNIPARQIREFIQEPAQDEFFTKRLQSVRAEFQKLEIQSADLYAKKILLQYALVRAVRPNIIVETGVANGVSSAYLLLALKANGQGTLYSIGLDDPQYLPKGKSLGWIVPQELQASWRLLVGNSKALLPALLVEIGLTDVFIHDSLHTYEHMIWEFRAVYPHLRSSGLLISDDANWNSAFSEFALEVSAIQAKVLRGVGYMQKGNR
jgi:cephalosporin hydroxylase